MTRFGTETRLERDDQTVHKSCAGGYGRDREGWKPVVKSSAFDGIPSSGSTNADSEPSIVSHKLRQGSSSSAMMNKQS
ncbi:hypothetical protein F2Q69_00046507 [Brassica cretica]|uniref:Uncharacterized protein n=1 Tax=Brassica cretica TaxID=69181 RepID=A0A8S9PX15_BRACR|nr:hypothetical protein F2Q69_00046507 [Brassica cretica]